MPREVGSLLGAHTIQKTSGEQNATRCYEKIRELR